MNTKASLLRPSTSDTQCFPGNPPHAATLLYGKGRNSKGTLIRVLKFLLRPCNCSAVGLHELTENRFRAATLHGRIANLAGDLDAKWIANTAAFKAITGGDTIQAEHKYGAPFDFTPWALPVYSTNKAFGSSESSEGWVSRWVVVPFPNTFTGKENRNLDNELRTEAELRGIMAKGIAALPALINRGRFTEPKSVTDAKEEFITASDADRSFIAEHCQRGGDAWVYRTELYKRYRQRTFDDGSKQLSAREFYQRVGQMEGITEHKRDGQRGFIGIRPRPPGQVSGQIADQRTGW